MSGLLDQMKKGADGIYGSVAAGGSQQVEIDMRRDVATRLYDDYLGEISQHHSVPVMDREVRRFLAAIPSNGVICDVGGCWGWIWRDIATLRPDVTILIVDFVRENLVHARMVLDGLVDKQVYLVHGDAKQLKLLDASIDGYWSVQVSQHIPELENVYREAFRILKPGGIFCDFVLNNAGLTRLVYRVAGRPYHLNGDVEGRFFLRRASPENQSLLSSIFKVPVRSRFTEILFSPEVGLVLPGRVGSMLGRLDSMISGFPILTGLVARQQSFHLTKR